MENLSGAVYKSFANKFVILDQPVGSGKTHYLAKQAIEAKEKVVYVTPSYEEAKQFIKELRDQGCTKKIVLLKGKHKLCIREYNKCHCKGCPYKKIVKVKPDNNFYTSRLYKNACPYYNLLNEARSADIIISHLSLLYKLWKNEPYKDDLLPYDPRKVILIIDEAEMVSRLLLASEIKIIELKEENTFQWLNIHGTSLLNFIKMLLEDETIFASTEDYQKFREGYGKVLNYLIHKLDPNNYRGSRRPVREALEAELKNIERDLFNMCLQLDLPIEEEDIIMRLRLKNDEDIYYLKETLIELLWALWAFKEIKIVRNKYDPFTDEIYIMAQPVPQTKAIFIMSHNKVILSSGSLTKFELNVLAGPETTIEKVHIDKLTHEYALVLYGRYNPLILARRLAKAGYISYVVQSSYNAADEFTRQITYRGKKGHIDVCTPRTIEELNECISKGIKIINLVQSGQLARNHRLFGHVAIVNTYISKLVQWYDLPEILKIKSVLGGTYQAMGRLLNYERRKVVLVMPEEVYKILAEKFSEMKVKVETISDAEEAFEKIRGWLGSPEPPKAKFQKTFRVVAKPIKRKKKGKTYTYAKIEILLPEEYVDKEFEVQLKEV